MFLIDVLKASCSRRDSSSLIASQQRVIKHKQLMARLDQKTVDPAICNVP